MTPLVFFSSLGVSAGFTNFQNSQNTYGNATINPPTKATVNDEMNCPVIVVSKNFTSTFPKHKASPMPIFLPTVQNHWAVTKSGFVGANKS